MSASLEETFQLIREAIAAPKRVTTDLGPGGRMSTQGKKNIDFNLLICPHTASLGLPLLLNLTTPVVPEEYA
jgi:hypothetical protein